MTLFLGTLGPRQFMGGVIGFRRDPPKTLPGERENKMTRKVKEDKTEKQTHKGGLGRLIRLSWLGIILCAPFIEVQASGQMGLLARLRTKV